VSEDSVGHKQVSDGLRSPGKREKKKDFLINVDWFVLFFSSFHDFLNNSQPEMKEVCSSRALATT